MTLHNDEKKNDLLVYDGYGLTPTWHRHYQARNDFKRYTTCTSMTGQSSGNGSATLTDEWNWLFIASHRCRY